MAQLSISEFQAKQILKNNWADFLSDFKYQTKSISVDLHQQNWIQELTKNSQNLNASLVVKPDMLFGKRSKNNLVYLKDTKIGDINLQKAIHWIQKVSQNTTKVYSSFDDKNQPTDLNNYIEGKLDKFIIEEFIQIQSPEYYLSFQTSYEGTIINFSEDGGVDVEEKWQSAVKTTLIDINNNNLLEGLNLLTQNIKLQNFIKSMYFLFTNLHFAYLEFNPFKLSNNDVYLLDTVAKVDSVAAYQMQKHWGEIETIKPFGKNFVNHNIEAIQALDQKSGASLKLEILNPNGQIWLLLAGGGASVVTLDTFISESKDSGIIANYGEYSGNPTRQETKVYTQNLLELMFQSKSQNKILFISGAIANFTDIKQTFLGITDAFESCKHLLYEQNIKIYVRRGGPNYKAGLELIKNFCDQNHLKTEVYGPEIGLTKICQKIILDNNL